MANSRTGSDERRTIHTVIAEFSRREVFKAAGLYAGGAWLLAEILLEVERPASTQTSLGALHRSPVLDQLQRQVVRADAVVPREGLQLERAVATGR